MNIELLQVQSLLKEAEGSCLEQKTFTEELKIEHQQFETILQQKLSSLEDEIEEGKEKYEYIFV